MPALLSSLEESALPLSVVGLGSLVPGSSRDRSLVICPNDLKRGDGGASPLLISRFRSRRARFFHTSPLTEENHYIVCLFVLIDDCVQ
jgi:hypothetical protein